MAFSSLPFFYLLFPSAVVVFPSGASCRFPSDATYRVLVCRSFPPDAVRRRLLLLYAISTEFSFTRLFPPLYTIFTEFSFTRIFLPLYLIFIEILFTKTSLPLYTNFTIRTFTRILPRLYLHFTIHLYTFFSAALHKHNKFLRWLSRDALHAHNKAFHFLSLFPLPKFYIARFPVPPFYYIKSDRNCQVNCL